MSAPTRSLLYRSRQTFSPWHLTGVTALGLGVATGWIGHPSLPAWANIVGLSPMVLLGGVGLRQTFQKNQHEELPWGMIAPVMILCFLTLFGLLRMSSPHAQGNLYPILYFGIALLVAFSCKKTSIALCLAALGVEALSQWFGVAFGATLPASWPPSPSMAQVDVVGMMTRAGCIVAFGSLAHVIHGAERYERKHQHRLEVERERENLLLEARQFRLIHSGKVMEAAASRQRSETLILRDALEAVHHTTYVSLRLLKTSLRCHSCVLLWFDARHEHLHIKELVSDCDAIVEHGFDAARGVIGGITRRREPVLMKDLKPGYRGLPYYREPQDIAHFLGVPVLEQGRLQGVLCVDRLAGAQAFGAQDVDMLEEAAAYIVRAVQNERLFATVEKSKHELGRFFEATRRLNSVLTPQDVYREALGSMIEITEFDLALFTTFDPEKGTHTVVHALGCGPWEAIATSCVDTTFGENQGWVSMVVKNRHYLPYNGQVRDLKPLVLTQNQSFHGLHSMLVLPLIAQDKVLGTLVIGHTQENQYPSERREMLEVVSHQVAVSLQNANLYAQMEVMATRDVLTGLPNRRTFMKRFEQAIARHKRSGSTFGILMTDIDHFKSVNDTYGHPVGDEVIRRVSGILTKTLRQTDMPARWGGEEFIVLLEDTDEQGCVVLAERLREALSQEVFHAEGGQTFSRTMSIGVGMWPADSQDLEELIERTDQALYHSKQNGRNKVTCFGALS